MVPPVSVATVETMKNGPGVSTTPCEVCRPMAMARDWNTARTTVR